MTTEHDPYEAGLGFAVRLDKGPFVGRDALQRKAATTPTRRLVPLRIADREAVVMGKEPVLVDAAGVGYVTSAAYGFRVDAPIASAWLPTAAAIAGRAVAIRYFGEPVPAIVAADPLFDPDMARLRV
jgi:glycine cleavage system aminomethyltransferase T